MKDMILCNLSTSSYWPTGNQKHKSETIFEVQLTGVQAVDTAHESMTFSMTESHRVTRLNLMLLLN